MVFIDMNKLTHDLVEGLGPKESKKLFMWVPANTIAAMPKGREDNTHLNIYGARVIAGITVDAIAKEVDFFSIGTNDLIQFTLAVDRTNELIANMFEPHHPAILNMIDRIVTAAHREGIIVSVCGEMSSDPLSTLVLVGLDVDELSMTPWSIMECKKIIRSINYEDVRATAKAVLKLDDAQSVNRYLRQKYLQTITDLGISSFNTSQDFGSDLGDP